MFLQNSQPHPLSELMRRHSPYNYAFNNPVYFIDPDGMMAGGFANTNPITSTGSFESYGGGGGGFDVRTFDRDGNTLDSVTVNNNQGVDISADGAITVNDLQTPGDGGGADLGLGGRCPDGDCGDALHKNSDKAISLEKWNEKYGGWSQEDIALEAGRDNFGLPNGPDDDWRYVINPHDGNVMDMRHVVVVGYGMGEVKGFGAEIVQKIAGWFGKDPTNSAFDLQDRYSNNIGSAFHTYDFRRNGINMSLNFGNNFTEFLNKVYNK